MDTERALSPLEEYLYEELSRIFDQGLLKSRLTAVQVRLPRSIASTVRMHQILIVQQILFLLMCVQGLLKLLSCDAETLSHLGLEEGAELSKPQARWLARLLASALIKPYHTEREWRAKLTAVVAAAAVSPVCPSFLAAAAATLQGELAVRIMSLRDSIADSTNSIVKAVSFVNNG
jgi:hypothetical protein